MGYGKSIELFLVNGTADSLITAELSNWNGMAFKIPRVEVSKYEGTDLSVPGVYFLFSRDSKTDADQVYIGEAEDVLKRLKQHLQDYNKGKETYEWNSAVVFVGKDLNKALIRYLEDRFVRIARECKRYEVLTKSSSANTVLKPSQVAAMEEFIDNVRVIINALGYKVIEPMLDSKEAHSEMYFMRTSSVDAKGIITPEGFVVLAGAKMNTKESKTIPESAHKRRIKEMKNVDKSVTTTDLLFSSSSAAASFLAGSSTSGPASWKREDGTTMREEH